MGRTERTHLCAASRRRIAERKDAERPPGRLHSKACIGTATWYAVRTPCSSNCERAARTARCQLISRQRTLIRPSHSLACLTSAWHCVRELRESLGCTSASSFSRIGIKARTGCKRLAAGNTAVDGMWVAITYRIAHRHVDRLLGSILVYTRCDRLADPYRNLKRLVLADRRIGMRSDRIGAGRLHLIGSRTCLSGRRFTRFGNSSGQRVRYALVSRHSVCGGEHLGDRLYRHPPTAQFASRQGFACLIGSDRDARFSMEQR